MIQIAKSSQKQGQTVHKRAIKRERNTVGQIDIQTNKNQTYEER